MGGKTENYPIFVLNNFFLTRKTVIFIEYSLPVMYTQTNVWAHFISIRFRLQTFKLMLIVDGSVQIRIVYYFSLNSE